jgi:tRNA(Ile)-lysidine synthase
VENKVYEIIVNHNMINEGDIVLVGVSGGADSLALLHVLRRLKKRISIQIYVAHVNHGLRGDAGDADEKFVADICGHWNIPFYSKKVNVSDMAEKWGLTEEETGRKVRYDFFYDTIREINGSRIALAHHRDDQVETIIHNLIRGCGLHGLHGMLPVRDDLIIRPLLYISREEIEEYCRKHDLDYRIDITNQDTVYTRNRIRHKLIPYIKHHFNASFSETIIRMAEIIRYEDDFISTYCSTLFKEHAIRESDKISIPLEQFLEYHMAVKRRIVRLCMQILRKDLTNVQANHIDSVIALAVNSKVGSLIKLPGNITITKDYQFIVFSNILDIKRIPAFDYLLTVPGKVYIQELNMAIESRRMLKKNDLYIDPWCIYIDEEAVNGDLRIRNRRTGDRFKPFGMNGTKKLKDYFIDKKVQKNQRDAVPLVVDMHSIVWVVGYQCNEDYRIRSNTKTLIEIRVSSKGKTNKALGSHINVQESAKKQLDIK